MENAIRQRQEIAVVELLGSPIPTYLRVALRAFYDSMEPSVSRREADTERKAA